MKTRHLLAHPFLLAIALTLGSAGYANAACTPSTYAYCWGQYESCIVNGGEEDDCVSEYFACLSRRGCG